jgi:iron uptake system component EfeO
MITTRSSRRAGEFVLPVRAALVCTSACAVLSLPLLSACTDNAPAEKPGAGGTPNPHALTVQATDTECKLSATSAPSGTLTFAVTNGGTKVNEFYLYGEDGKQIIGEVENIGPGISRELVLKVTPGSYITACKPGMSGEGIRAPFSVSDSGEEQGTVGYHAELVEQANAKVSRVRRRPDQSAGGHDRKICGCVQGGQ